MKVEKLAGCVITNTDGEVLLIHRNTPRFKQWEIPGGKREPGEKYSATAQREALEELGVKVGNLAYIGFTFFAGRSSNFVQVLFKGEILDGKPAAQEEKHDYADYFALNKAERIGLKLSAGVRALNESVQNGRIQL